MIIIIVILKIKKIIEAACNKMVFISAICHGQWYFTSYVLQKLFYFFIIMSPNQLTFPFLLKLILDFSTFSKHIE